MQEEGERRTDGGWGGGGGQGGRRRGTSVVVPRTQIFRQDCVYRYLLASCVAGGLASS